MLTPYQFASNTPIMAIDLDGLEAVEANMIFKLAMWYTKLKNGTDNMVQATANTGSSNDPNVPKKAQTMNRIAQAGHGAQAVNESLVEAGELTAETINTIPGVDVVGDPLFAFYYAKKGDYESSATYTAGMFIPIVSGGVIKQTLKVGEILRWEVKAGEDAAEKIGELMKKIEKDGIESLPPIEVYIHDGVNYLIDGHHRLAAAKAAGIENIPVKYLSNSEFKVKAKEMGRFSTIDALKAIAERVKNISDVSPVK